MSELTNLLPQNFIFLLNLVGPLALSIKVQDHRDWCTRLKNKLLCRTPPLPSQTPGTAERHLNTRRGERRQDQCWGFFPTLSSSHFLVPRPITPTGLILTYSNRPLGKTDPSWAKPETGKDSFLQTGAPCHPICPLAWSIRSSGCPEQLQSGAHSGWDLPTGEASCGSSVCDLP